TADAGVFTINASATSPVITNLEDNGLSWRVIASDIYQGKAMVDRVDILADEQGVERVLILSKDDAFGRGLSDAVVGPLAGIVGASNVKAVFYDDPADFNFDPDRIADAYSQTVQAALAQMPDP